jgi:hypothetical protein
MANEGEENLIPLNKRTKDEQREIARKGGKASGRSRKDKRTFRETLAYLLEFQDKDKNGNPLVSPITGKPMSIRENILMQALLKARKGDIKAFLTILETMGERLTKAEAEVTIKTDKYDTMTKEELQAEAKRLADSMNNP